MKTNIDNETYEAAYNNRDNQKVMLKAVSKFRKQFNDDELRQYMQSALLRCLRTYNPKYGQKFTTSLYKYTIWECLRAVQVKAKQLPTISPCVLSQYVCPTHDRQAEIDHIFDCIELLNPTYRTLIDQYYVQGMTLEEIGATHSYTKQNAFGKIRRAVKELRRICHRDYQEMV